METKMKKDKNQSTTNQQWRPAPSPATLKTTSPIGKPTVPSNRRDNSHDCYFYAALSDCQPQSNNWVSRRHFHVGDSIETPPSSRRRRRRACPANLWCPRRQFRCFRLVLLMWGHATFPGTVWLSCLCCLLSRIVLCLLLGLSLYRLLRVVRRMGVLPGCFQVSVSEIVMQSRCLNNQICGPYLV